MFWYLQRYSALASPDHSHLNQVGPPLNNDYLKKVSRSFGVQQQQAKSTGVLAPVTHATRNTQHAAPAAKVTENGFVHLPGRGCNQNNPIRFAPEVRTACLLVGEVTKLVFGGGSEKFQKLGAQQTAEQRFLSALLIVPHCREAPIHLLCFL